MHRVLHISANNYPGLEEFHFTKRIWLELAKGAEEYHVLARGKNNHFSHYKEGNLYLHLVPSWGKRERSFMLSSFYMIVLIRRYKINKLLAQSPLLGGLTASLVSRWWKIPMMVELHGEHYFSYVEGNGLKHRFMALLTRVSLRQAKVVRALNPMMAERLKKAGIQHVTVIPNRVDTALFTPPKEDYSLHIPIQLISIGRFVEEKNYALLIQKMASWQRPFFLRLIGGGPQRSQLEEIIKQNGLELQVQLIDWITQKELVAFMAQSDVYIQSSKSEALPRTLLEAMALGLPCVTTNAGCIQGTITHEKQGMLVAKNLDDLLVVLDEIVDNATKRAQLGASARQEILQNYEWHHCFDKYRQGLYGM